MHSHSGLHHGHVEVGLDLLRPQVSRAFDGNDGTSRGLRRKRSFIHVEDPQRVYPMLNEQLGHRVKKYVNQRHPYLVSHYPDALRSAWYEHRVENKKARVPSRRQLCRMYGSRALLQRVTDQGGALHDLYAGNRVTHALHGGNLLHHVALHIC